jgi:alpha-1,2-mannosyltransferase
VIQPVWDYTALYDLEPRVNLCYGAEWYRFPSSYLVPEGIEVNWVKGEFDGMMPRRWDAAEDGGEAEAEGWWPKETSVVRAGRFNGENKASAEPGTYVSQSVRVVDVQANGQVSPDTCDYIVALSLPSRKATAAEPDWTQHPEWEVEHCVPFLDAAATPFWARLVDLPKGAGGFEGARTWGRYCLVKRKGSAYGTA